MQEVNFTIAFAESVTCGLAVHQLNTVKGTSEVLLGSIICYHEKAKTKLLNINSSLISKHTAESQQVTDAMAYQLSRLLAANISAAITGLSAAGGSESASKPVGTIFYSVYFKKKYYRSRKVFRGTPLQIKKRAVKYLFEWVTQLISKK